MEEIWKDIPGGESYYQASNLGNIKSLSRVIMKNGAYHYTSKEMLLKLCMCNTGYFMVYLCRNGVKKSIQVHQLVAMAFLGHKTCGYKAVINHKNFTPTDNRVENLEIVTQRENANFKHIPSSSKYTGVSWDKGTKKWRAYIYNGVKLKYLGLFTNELEASNTYQEALIKINNQNQ